MRISAIVAAAIALLSCEREHTPSVSPGRMTLRAGSFRQNFAETGYPLHFPPEGDFMATVDSSGVVTGHRVGSTCITVRTDFLYCHVCANVTPVCVFLPGMVGFLGASDNEIEASFGCQTKDKQEEEYRIMEYGRPGEVAEYLLFTVVGGKCNAVFFTAPKYPEGMVKGCLDERYVQIGPGVKKESEAVVYNGMHTTARISLPDAGSASCCVLYNPHL